MNYKKHYIKLIRKSQNRELPKETYTEKHHIFPKSIYKNSNMIVKLTAKEHLIAHLLIWKYFNKKYGSKDQKTIKMMWAAWRMSHSNSAYNKINTRIYTILKKECSVAASIRLLGKHPSEETKQKMSLAKSGENNPNFGKQRSEETKQKMSLANSGENHPMFGRKGENHPMFGKQRSEETKQKMSLAKKYKMKPVKGTNKITRRNKRIRKLKRHRKRWISIRKCLEMLQWSKKIS